MELKFLNSSIAFAQKSTSLADVYTNYDEDKFNSFIETIGGKNGAIWAKIKVLWMPIFSSLADGNIYYDVKSNKIVGVNADNARKIWQETSDVNINTIKGYKQNQSDEILDLNWKCQDITTDDVCFFNISAHNPNPGTSLKDWTVHFEGNSNLMVISNLKGAIEMKYTTSTNAMIASLSADKLIKDFSKTVALCTSNVDGVVGIASNNTTFKSSEGRLLTEVYDVKTIAPNGREKSNTEIYGGMFTIFGVAKGFTSSEAQTMVSALEIFME